MDGHKLTTDARPLNGFSTITAEIVGRGFSAANVNALAFTISDPLNDHAFENKNIFADLYDSSHMLVGSYNVKDLVATGATIPITVVNGLSYTMDVRFTPVPSPSTGALAGIAGLCWLGYARARMLARRRQ